MTVLGDRASIEAVILAQVLIAMPTAVSSQNFVGLSAKGVDGGPPPAIHDNQGVVRPTQISRG
jgi:hypothetical protein